MPGEFHFLRPEWFFALIPAVLVSLLVIKKTRPASGWENICDPALLKYQIIETGHIHSNYQTWLRWLTPLVLLICIIALAGPSWSKKEQPVFQKNSPVVIVLDLSFSMNATDIKPSRLERAKLKIMDILQSRSEGQSALIAYAGDTHIVSPLTIDNKTIISLLPALNTSIMPVPGSQMSDALKAAQELLRNAGMSRGKIIVLTDSVDDQKAYAKAVQLKSQGYQLSVIGVGTVAGSPVPSPQQNGFMKDSLGQVVLSKLEPLTLEQLAQSGGGEFHTLRVDDADFRHVLQPNPLDDERAITEQDDQIEQWIDQGALLTLFIIPFALLAFRKGILVVVFCLLFVPVLFSEPIQAQVTHEPPQNNATAKSSLLDYLWKTPDQKGQEAYDRKDFTTAALHFENSQWKAGANYRSGSFQQAIDEYAKTDTADSWYNQGNALANLGHFNAAVNAYDEALKRDPALKDAQANRQYIEELLKKQQQPQQDQPSPDQDSDKQQQQESSDSQTDSQQSESQNSEDQQQQDQQDQQDQQSQQDQSQNSQTDESQDENSQSDQDQQQSESQQTANEQDEQQQQENASSTQDLDQQNQPEQQDERSQDPAAANHPQQELADPEQEHQQAAQQSAENQLDETAMEDSQEQESARPARDIMSQLSKEEQQSLNQWLQRIPDDPSELLRRKFYYNSQNRQRQQPLPPQSKGNPW